MKRRTVCVNKSVIESILDYAKACHPKEGILLLRGKMQKDRILIDEVEIPPLAVHGYVFSNFPMYRLPIDFSVIGTAHSHPSGVLQPSTADLNNFYGRTMIIAVYPYMSESDIGVFDREGHPIEYEMMENH